MSDRSILINRPPLVFAGSPLDRGELLRRDRDKLAAQAKRENAWTMVLFRGLPAMAGEDGLGWMKLDECARLYGPALLQIYLGELRGDPVFATELAQKPPAEAGLAFMDARQAAMALSQSEAAIFAHAKALLAWHERHGFCANCGLATEIVCGGAKRVCGGCQAEHFPRVDPVVIMLATDGENCLLGRQASWPPGIWSALAGFVEPAETIEEACARELQEEAGVIADIAAIRYVMTQPWPFPSSMMVGLVAPVTHATVKVDQHELEDARWFSRDEVRAMLIGHHPDAQLPPSVAIARRLVELWADGEI
ncbi:NAD(+) diphosphatase [Maricaulis salignorans]|uniref:NAD(+) diphosphatase n=1 Tax=Maricaulis salignorans TaxID=144026 RepID=A0A1G9NCY5_9PROT|nr:NAD(+) diphosphatase [Maricaulis salignorans]SDL84243.1 NAD+ diphosphatase [Maricaulis salignorans]